MSPVGSDDPPGRSARHLTGRYAASLFRFRFLILISTIPFGVLLGTSPWRVVLAVAVALLVWLPMGVVWGSAVVRSAHELRVGLRD